MGKAREDEDPRLEVIGAFPSEGDYHDQLKQIAANRFPLPCRAPSESEKAPCKIVTQSGRRTDLLDGGLSAGLRRRHCFWSVHQRSRFSR